MEIENSPNRESVTVTLLMFQAKRIPPALSTKGRKFQLLNQLTPKSTQESSVNLIPFRFQQNY